MRASLQCVVWGDGVQPPENSATSAPISSHVTNTHVHHRHRSAQAIILCQTPSEMTLWTLPILCCESKWSGASPTVNFLTCGSVCLLIDDRCVADRHPFVRDRVPGRQHIEALSARGRSHEGSLEAPQTAPERTEYQMRRIGEEHVSPPRTSLGQLRFQLLFEELRLPLDVFIDRQLWRHGDRANPSPAESLRA